MSNGGSKDPRSARPSPVFWASSAVVVGVLIFATVVTVASNSNSSTTTSNPNTDLYVVGKARSLAPSVDRDGPLLFQDLLGRTRDIYVQHITGDDWRTFEANAPGAGRECILRWDNGDRRFHDPCSSATFPADGAGLTSFPTSVNDEGLILVDLRRPQTPVTTTLAPATTVGPATTAAPPPG